MSIKPGVRLGDRYQLLTLIATGGMGQVWRAEDTTLHRVVAAKVLRSEFTGDATFLARFRAEAQNTAALSHPNIASVYDYGETVQDSERLAYLVMELVEGEPLVEILHRERRIPPARVLDILQQAATGLDAAHRAGMVHRDIKPGNLIIRPDGVLKITDFGIARAANNVPLTDNGTVVGTAQYLAPEQAEGRPAIAASDVYALGVVGYECLAGFRPFDGDNSVAIALSQIRDTPRPLPMDVSPTIRDLINRAMAKNPRTRFGNGGGFAEAIKIVRSGGTLPPPPGPGLAPNSATLGIPQTGPGQPGPGQSRPGQQGPAQPGPGLNPASQTMTGAPMPANRPYAGPPGTSQQRPVGPAAPGTGHVQQGPHLPPGSGMIPSPASTGQYAGPPTGVPAPESSSKRPWIIVGVVALLAILIVIVALIVNSSDDEPLGRGGGTPAPAVTTSATTAQPSTETSPEAGEAPAPGDQPDPGEVFSLDLSSVLGQPVELVVPELQNTAGLVVSIEEDGTGYPPGTVSDVEPSTELQVGDPVVVHVVPDSEQPNSVPEAPNSRPFFQHSNDPQGLRINR